MGATASAYAGRQGSFFVLAVRPGRCVMKGENASEQGACSPVEESPRANALDNVAFEKARGPAVDTASEICYISNQYQRKAA